MCLAIPGKIDKIISNENNNFKTGKVLFNNTEVEVNLSLVPEAKLGDYVLVHTGIAINVIDEEEAQKTFELLKELEELENEM